MKAMKFLRIFCTLGCLGFLGGLTASSAFARDWQSGNAPLNVLSAQSSWDGAQPASLPQRWLGTPGFKPDYSGSYEVLRWGDLPRFQEPQALRWNELPKIQQELELARKGQMPPKTRNDQGNGVVQRVEPMSGNPFVVSPP